MVMVRAVLFGVQFIHVKKCKSITCSNSALGGPQPRDIGVSRSWNVVLRVPGHDHTLNVDGSLNKRQGCHLDVSHNDIFVGFT